MRKIVLAAAAVSALALSACSSEPEVAEEETFADAGTNVDALATDTAAETTELTDETAAEVEGAAVEADAAATELGTEAEVTEEVPAAE